MQSKTILSKDFILIVLGQIISVFGNQILRYVLPLYLLIKTGSSAIFGTITASSFIPMIVLFPIGGVIADRLNKKNIMVILDFLTGILVCAFYFLQNRLDIVPLIAVTMIILYGIQGIYQPAVKSSIPILIDEKNIMQANSIVDVINSLASMAGPVIGGILFSFLGIEFILYISIACFILSAIMEMFICIDQEKIQTEKNIIYTVKNDLKESFTFMFKTKPILWKISLIYSSVNLFLVSLILIALPVLIIQHLGFDGSVANRLYGYAQGIIAIGAILGGVFAGVFSNKLNASKGRFILYGCSLSVFIGGVAIQTLNASMNIYIVLVIGCGLLVFLSTLFQIQLMSYIQILTPKNLIGKVMSCVICVCMCTAPIGQFIYGFVFDYINNYYLPFYIASFIVFGIGFLSRSVFSKLENSI
ncbi:MAG: MFS transporter [Peptostreptococcus sp.]|uniref:MFS transporter n=1 Tax=Peptostreptococcus sp. TaxID=1262 RepID=UPI002FCBCB77